MQNEENLQKVTQENITPTEGENQEQDNVVQKENSVQPTQEQNKPRNFTQDQVNKLMRNRLERDRMSFFKRYGVNDRNGLDGLIGKSQAYDVMKERYENIKGENAQLKEKLAFISNGINPDREDDIRAHFKGKGLEFNEESLVNELETHPEWRKVVETGDTTPKTTIKVFGVEHKDKNVPETEAERQKRVFGI